MRGGPPPGMGPGGGGMMPAGHPGMPPPHPMPHAPPYWAPHITLESRIYDMNKRLQQRNDVRYALHIFLCFFSNNILVHDLFIHYFLTCCTQFCFDS